MTHEPKRRVPLGVTDLLAPTTTQENPTMTADHLPITITRPEIEPTRAHPDDAGLDLRADIDRPFTLGRGSRALIPTGVTAAIPAGHAGLVCPRSGTALKHGVTITNAPGVIDAGYRGDIGVVLHNLGAGVFTIRPGDRIAQLVIVPIVTPATVVVETLDDTDRGAGGFGSTGVQEAGK